MLKYISLTVPKDNITFQDLEGQLHELRSMTNMLMAYQDYSEGRGNDRDEGTIVFAIADIHARAGALIETFNAAHTNRARE